ncbi:MAG TPA: hypothetical protein DCW29_14260 [Janthinobacterium sp.]|nr:hypothetical protein [Janthinobacterium sp.]
MILRATLVATLVAGMTMSASAEEPGGIGGPSTQSSRGSLLRAPLGDSGSLSKNLSGDGTRAAPGAAVGAGAAPAVGTSSGASGTPAPGTSFNGQLNGPGLGRPGVALGVGVSAPDATPPVAVDSASGDTAASTSAALIGRAQQGTAEAASPVAASRNHAQRAAAIADDAKPADDAQGGVNAAPTAPTPAKAPGASAD